jgi:hypothetical protein
MQSAMVPTEARLLTQELDNQGSRVMGDGRIFLHFNVAPWPEVLSGGALTFSWKEPLSRSDFMPGLFPGGSSALLIPPVGTLGSLASASPCSQLHAQEGYAV